MRELKAISWAMKNLLKFLSKYLQYGLTWALEQLTDFTAKFL